MKVKFIPQAGAPKKCSVTPTGPSQQQLTFFNANPTFAIASVTKGDTLLLETALPFGTLANNVTDTQGNVWTKIAEIQIASVIFPPGVERSIWFTVAGATGALTITANLSAVVVSVLRFVGFVGPKILNGAATTGTGLFSGATYVAGPFTPPVKAPVFILEANDNSNDSPAAPYTNSLIAPSDVWWADGQSGPQNIVVTTFSPAINQSFGWILFSLKC